VHPDGLRASQADACIQRDFETQKARHAREHDTLSEAHRVLTDKSLRLEEDVARLTEHEVELQNAFARKLEQKSDELHELQAQHKADRRAWEKSMAAKLAAVEAARKAQVAAIQASPVVSQPSTPQLSEPLLGSSLLPPRQCMR
jgi:peptidoglycan hydrolase CwlO-like protein